jgi:hypothetical protein
MTTKINAAVRRRLAGSALGGLIAFAGVPAAMAQWLPPWPSVASYGDIAQRLEAQGYVLIAPLQRRPGVYLADVRAGPAGYQRLVIDDRNGEILERFMAPPRNYRPEFAARYDQFGQPPPPGAGQPPPPGAVQPPPPGAGQPPPPGAVQPPPGPGFSDAPNGGPAANVHIPSAISPYGPQSGPGSTKPKSQSTITARKIPPAKTAPAGAPPTVGPPLPPPAPREAAKETAPAGAPPTVGPPLPPPAPREAAKPEELAPPAPKPEPKIESPPGESENASTAGAPAAPEAKPEAVKIEPQPEAQTQPADSALDPTAKRAAPASSVEASEKSKVSIVPPALFE